MRRMMIAGLLLAALGAPEAVRGDERPHCGPGRLTFRTDPRLDSRCEQHDRSYGQVPGRAKYIPGWGNEQIRRADQTLIRQMDALRRDATLPGPERAKAAAIQGAFMYKNAADRVVSAERSALQRLGSSLQSGQRASVSALRRAASQSPPPRAGTSTGRRR